MPRMGNAQRLQSALNSGGQGNHGGISHEVEAERMAPGSLVARTGHQIRRMFGLEDDATTGPVANPDEPRAHAARRP